MVREALADREARGPVARLRVGLDLAAPAVRAVLDLADLADRVVLDLADRVALALVFQAPVFRAAPVRVLPFRRHRRHSRCRRASRSRLMPRIRRLPPFSAR